MRMMVTRTAPGEVYRHIPIPPGQFVPNLPIPGQWDMSIPMLIIASRRLFMWLSIAAL